MQNCLVCLWSVFYIDESHKQWVLNDLNRGEKRPNDLQFSAVNAINRWLNFYFTRSFLIPHELYIFHH